MQNATPNSTVRASRSAFPHRPNLRYERAAWQAGYEFVAGADEVGRGAWAGPLVAAAVLLPRDAGVRRRLTRQLNQSNLEPQDSKLMSPGARSKVVDVLQRMEIPFAVCELSPAEVDKAGVGVANRAALCTAIHSLIDVDYALLDAFNLDDLRCDGQAIVGGDRRCLSIALASIVAKVHRDAFMLHLDTLYPGYGFGQHKGYGTRMHATALETLGVTDQHRKSFQPIAERLVRV